MVALKEDLIGELLHVISEQRAALETLAERIDADTASAALELLERFLLHATEAQHKALDVAFTILLSQDREFRASQSGAPWLAVNHGYTLMRRVREHLGGESDADG